MTGIARRAVIFPQRGRKGMKTASLVDGRLRPESGIPPEAAITISHFIPFDTHFLQCTFEEDCHQLRAN